MKHTIVIVTHQTDYEVLCLQARSMSKYLSPSLVEQILVVENPTKLDNHDHLFEQYGSIQGLVTLVEGTEIAPPQAFQASGWFSQQILKLLIAKHVTTPRYLVLDAKNVMVHPLTKSYLERNGKPRMYYRDFTEHTSMRWLRNTLNYFSLPESHASQFMPTTTPFIFETDLVKELIRYVEDREAVSFTTAFLKKQLTEFFLYAGYLLSTNQMCYDFTAKECKTIWDTVHSDEYVKDCIAYTRKYRLPFLSVHRRAVPLMSDNARRLMLDFWQTRGLDGSVIL